jgi:hypothetical protein
MTDMFGNHSRDFEFSNDPLAETTAAHDGTSLDMK